MRVVFASHHAPRLHGTSSGRVVFALVEALRAEGHDATAWCWGTTEPVDLPDWAQWRRLPEASWAAVKARALLWPRTDAARLAYAPPEDSVVIADDTISWPAVRGAPRAVLNIHNSLALDHVALGAVTAAGAQDLRAERRATRQAGSVWTSSSRVRDALGRATVVPYTLPVPAGPVDLVDAPVVGMLADWSWSPNAVALRHLLAEWPAVRDEVPGAMLLLAGRGDANVGVVPGVRDLGEVGSVADLLAQVAVFAFPCPPSSGAKMKSFEAVVHGVPLLTTPAGAEGMVPGAAHVVRPGGSFADELVRLLRDQPLRRRLAVEGRGLVLEHHSPRVAALARLATL